MGSAEAEDGQDQVSDYLCFALGEKVKDEIDFLLYPAHGVCLVVLRSALS